MTYFCPYCFAEHAATALLCPRCGGRLDVDRRDYVEKLIQALRHPAPSVPCQAAMVLGQLGNLRAVEPLIEALRARPEIGLQEAAAEALGRLRDERAVLALAEALRHSYLTVRERAAWALGEISTDEARAALREALKDRNASVREAAAKALSAEPSDAGIDPVETKG